MRFRIHICCGKEVLFIGDERGNSRPTSDWDEAGRWKINLSLLETYLTEHLDKDSYGESVECFVFCFEIADFELWGDFFRSAADYSSYRPKSKEYWCVGQLRWSDVKNHSPDNQLGALRQAIANSIAKCSAKPRKPKHFSFEKFAFKLDELLSKVPVTRLIAMPATQQAP